MGRVCQILPVWAQGEVHTPCVRNPLPLHPWECSAALHGTISPDNNS
jgi:hypothetical protein